MSAPLTRKEVTHDRIVSTAARIIRRSGYSGVGVADIMKEAGLTHGGFYAHFPSRTALLAAAADRASADSLEALRQATLGVPPEGVLDAVVAYYLSDAHVDAAEHGCPLAALCSEMPRQEPEVKDASTRNIKEMVSLLESHVPGGEPEGVKREKAMAALSCLVGSLVLARAVNDEGLSTALRDASRKLLSGYLNDR